MISSVKINSNPHGFIIIPIKKKVVETSNKSHAGLPILLSTKFDVWMFMLLMPNVCDSYVACHF